MPEFLTETYAPGTPRHCRVTHRPRTANLAPGAAPQAGHDRSGPVAVTRRPLIDPVERPACAEGGELIAVGSVSHRSKRLSVANAVVTCRGRRIAIATGTTALTPPE
jgi:hypothetical protein